MLTVVFYARVSTLDEEQKNAIKAQVIELESFINENPKWQLVDKYVDKGKSGTSIKGRTQYNRLCADIEEDKFDIIVVKDESRLNRNILNWYLFIDSINQNKKQLFFYMARKFYSSNDDMITGIKALMAKEYSKDLSKKINNAHRHRQLNGKVCTSSTLLGYDLINKELVINGEQAKIIKFIFEKYVEGDGFTTIAIYYLKRELKT